MLALVLVLNLLRSIWNLLTAQSPSVISNHRRCSIKKTNLITFTGKYLPWSFYFLKLQSFYKLYQKKSSTQAFFCEYCKIFSNNYFEEHLRMAASEGFNFHPCHGSRCCFWKVKGLWISSKSYLSLSYLHFFKSLEKIEINDLTLKFNCISCNGAKFKDIIR